MLNNRYKKAYKEVLEIIKCFPKEEYNRIPKEKIIFLQENMDKNYIFSMNPEINLSKQISREANAIIISLYLEYFATEEQRIKIFEILRINQQKAEKEKRNRFNPDNVFKHEKKM